MFVFSRQGTYILSSFRYILNMDAKLLLLFMSVKVLWPSQPTGVMSSAVTLHNQTFTGQS